MVVLNEKPSDNLNKVLVQAYQARQTTVVAFQKVAVLHKVLRIKTWEVSRLVTYYMPIYMLIWNYSWIYYWPGFLKVFYAFELVNKQSKNQKYSSKCTNYDFLPIFPNKIGGGGGDDEEGNIFLSKTWDTSILNNWFCRTVNSTLIQPSFRDIHDTWSFDILIINISGLLKFQTILFLYLLLLWYSLSIHIVIFANRRHQFSVLLVL